MKNKDLIAALSKADPELLICQFTEAGPEEVEDVWIFKGSHNISMTPKMVWGRANGKYIGIGNPGDYDVSVSQEDCEPIQDLTEDAVRNSSDSLSHEKNWKVMSVTRGGTVSLIKDLTKAEAEFMRCRLLGLPATPEEAAREREQWERAHPPGPNYENNGQNVSKEQWAEWNKQHPYAQGCRYPNGGSSWGGGRLVQDSDMKTVEIFQ
jgi:hypothetical protein